MRLRLILIPAAILSLGIAVAIGATLFDARIRIASEIGSGVRLGNLLIGYALEDIAKSADPDRAVQRLRDGIGQVRHIRLTRAAPAAEPGREIVQPPPPPPTAKQRSSAPGWFSSLFEPARIVAVYPLSFGGAGLGELVVSSEPADEVAEIWNSLVFLTSLLSTLSFAIVVLIWLTARHTLQPIHRLVEGLDRLGRGQYGAVDQIHIAELSQIGEEFNRLAGSLARAEDNNRLLIDRLFSIQESERKDLARELHDEFGALLFGIRAAASCIVEAAKGIADSACAAEITGRAEAVAALADAIQKQNYRILDRIRPIALHQMGLGGALRELVHSWRSRHSGFTCTVEIAAALDAAERGLEEDVCLTSYRIVQEALTNAARHSKAKLVRIALDYRSGAGTLGGMPELVLSIEDDGIGLPAGCAYGFGFLGMIERVRKLGGHLRIANSARAGLRIEVLIPAGGIAA